MGSWFSTLTAARSDGGVAYGRTIAGSPVSRSGGACITAPSTSAAFTVGTWLTRSLFVAYRRRFEARADENTGEAQAEYWVTRRVMLDGVLGDRGHSGVDLLWRKRY